MVFLQKTKKEDERRFVYAYISLEGSLRSEGLYFERVRKALHYSRVDAGCILCSNYVYLVS